MPKIKRIEESLPPEEMNEPQLLKEEPSEELPSEPPKEKQAIPETSKKEVTLGEGLDVLRLVDDLHSQLLTSTRAKKALEMDLVSSQRTIHQLTLENKELRSQVEKLKNEIQKGKEVQSEWAYLKEENADALEKIRDLMQTLKEMKESLALAKKEKEEAILRTQQLEAQIEQNEILRVKGRLKEKEALHFSSESRELQSKLEQALAYNLELEKKYEALKTSFNEVKESLTVLRDSCKANFYNLLENPE
jgi:chromosome segregation ATPase